MRRLCEPELPNGGSGPRKNTGDPRVERGSSEYPPIPADYLDGEFSPHD